MKTTRLFVDAHVLDGPHQGSVTFIREIFSRLARQPGIQLYVGAEREDRIEQAFGRRANVEFVPYSTPSRFRRLGVELPRLLHKIKPDFAHFTYIVPPIKTCRYLVTTHDLLFRDFPEEFPLSYRVSKSALFRASLGMADLITTISNYSRDSIHRHFGIAKERIHLTPCGVSEEFTASYEAQTARDLIQARFGIQNYILCVSRIEPRKKQVNLLRAYLELGLAKQGIALVFIGVESIADPELNQLRESADEEARRSIHFLKGISSEDLLTFYRAARLFVYPSVAEGFGMPPLEAGALGIPTLCSNTTAMGDFTFFGEGHLPPSYEALKHKLAQFLMECPPQPEELRRIAQEIRETYSWDRSAEVLYHLIQSYGAGTRVPGRKQAVAKPVLN